MTKPLRRWLVGLMIVAALSAPVAAQPTGLIVSVAASVYDALEEIAELYRATTGVTVSLNAGGSNTLARQIVEGAKAGLFISADNRQMDVVEKAGRIVTGSRTRLLTNELALVVPADAKTFTIERLLRGEVTRLALGEPGAVPSGVYARAWLEHEGAWRRLESKVIPFPTVTAVLTAVESGRVDAGVVYRTDAMRSTSVRAIGHISSTQHRYLDISYPAAVIAGPSEAEAMRFLQFLMGTSARAVFDRRGFGRP
ncbi:MAG: molybdate ABC transporter substrate-binding protein [Vicinamibacterales bacterium]